MPNNEHWNLANRMAAGGDKLLRQALKKKAWSAAPVAKANPEGYWRSLQGAVAVLVTFEARVETPGKRGVLATSEESSRSLSVMLDLAAWRGCDRLAGDDASQRRWSRALVAATDAQCRLTYGPEGVLGRQSRYGKELPLSRLIVKAIARDALALAPLLDARFWPEEARMVAPVKGFIDRVSYQPSDRRDLPLAHCRFVAAKPMSEEDARQAIDALKLRLAEVFGPAARMETGEPGPRPGSLQWRAHLEGRSIAEGLAPQESPAEGAAKPPVKAPRPRL